MEEVKPIKGMQKIDQEQMICADTTRLTKFWQLRDSIMQSDRDRTNLIRPEKQTTAFKYWPTAEPKVFFDTARSLISLYPPRFKLPIPINFSPEEKDKMNKAERLCIGIWRNLDRRVADTGGTSWLYELAYWLLGGWYSIFSVVQKGEEGPEFIADLYDPITVYPEWTKYGLSKCVRHYSVDETTCESMAAEFQEKGLEFDYRKPQEGDSYTVTNYWMKEGKKVWNAIMLNKGIVKPMTLQRSLDRIPILVGAVGIPDRVSPNWQMRKGESIIASARENYDFITQLRSLRAEIVEQTAFPNIVSKTRTGQPAVKAEDVKGHGSVLPLKLEDVLDTLKNAASPNDVNILEQEIGQELQKATLPNVVYGGISTELSGFAISQLLAAIKYKLGPYVNAENFIVGQLMSNLLYQFRSANFGKVTLSTRNPYDLKRGMNFIEEFSKDDVPERIFVEAEVPITSQYDKTQAILNSVQALQAGLLSKETLWENELDIQDAEQEKLRLAEDAVSADPFVRQIEIITKMYERVQVYELAGMVGAAEALKRYIGTLETNLGITQGVGTPAKVRGTNPEQRPVEATPASPDIKNAATGTPPTKGIIYTPQGQPVL